MSEKENLENEVSEIGNRKYPDGKVFLDCFKECNTTVCEWILNNFTSILTNRINNFSSPTRKPRIQLFKDGTKARIRESVLFDIGSKLSLYLEINCFVLNQLSEELEHEKSWTYLYYDTSERMPDPINKVDSMQLLIEKEESKLRKKGNNFYPMTSGKNDYLKRSDIISSSTQQSERTKIKYFWDLYFVFIH